MGAEDFIFQLGNPPGIYNARNRTEKMFFIRVKRLHIPDRRRMDVHQYKENTRLGCAPYSC